MKQSADITFHGRLSVAPMMDWTDRHCRYFHRLMSRNTMLYTEMVTSAAVIHGPKKRLLDFDRAEHPIALQLGGSDPKELAQAVKIVQDWGYDEINLNAGCPSDRVQSGAFGAILMKNPPLVAQCLSAMRSESDVPITLKCRIGIDDQNAHETLPFFLDHVAKSGVRHVIIHARNAWLQGLSPKENRDIPPLDYGVVLKAKKLFPELFFTINGGVTTLQQAQKLLKKGMDGVMIGRAAYHNPGAVLLSADTLLWGVPSPYEHPQDVILALRPYIQNHLNHGGRLHQITRHILGLFASQPGARSWRRVLSENASKRGAGLEVIDLALDQLTAVC